FAASMTPAPTSTPALIMISAMVMVAALLVLTTMILSTLNERRPKMAILRSVGASPRTVVGLLMIEAGLLSLLGFLLGVSLLYLGLYIARPIVDAQYGLYLPIGLLSPREIVMLLLIVGARFAVALLPAFRGYQMSLADGMTVRV